MEPMHADADTRAGLLAPPSSGSPHSQQTQPTAQHCTACGPGKMSSSCRTTHSFHYPSSTQIWQKLREKTVEKMTPHTFKNLLNSLSFYAISLITLTQKSNYTSALAASEVFLGLFLSSLQLNEPHPLSDTLCV